MDQAHVNQCLHELAEDDVDTKLCVKCEQDRWVLELKNIS